MGEINTSTSFLKIGQDTPVLGLEDEGHIYQISREKVLALQVCTTIYPDDKDSLKILEMQVNQDYPCGTQLGWIIEHGGDQGPVRCHDVPKRHHYILNC